MYSATTKVLAALTAAGLMAMTPFVQAATGAKELFWGPDGPTVIESPSAQKSNAKAEQTAGVTKNIRRAPSTTGLQVWVNLVDSTGKSQRVSPASHMFKSGDKIELEFRTNTSGYLYVVNVGSSGMTRPLFPRTSGQDNFVEAWTQAKLSSRIVFDNTPGTEQLAVVLSKSPRRDVNLQGADGRLLTVGLDREGKLAMTDAASSPSQQIEAPSGGSMPGGTATQPPAGGAATVANKRGGADTVTLALADLQGAKDLTFEDDGQTVTVVMRTEAAPSSSTAKGRVPLVVNLKLKHE